MKVGRPKINTYPLKNIALRLCELGHINEEIAYIIGVSCSTFNRWLKYDRVFWQSMQDRKVEFDSSYEVDKTLEYFKNRRVVDYYEDDHYIGSVDRRDSGDVVELFRYLRNRKTF